MCARAFSLYKNNYAQKHVNFENFFRFLQDKFMAHSYWERLDKELNEGLFNPKPRQTDQENIAEKGKVKTELMNTLYAIVQKTIEHQAANEMQKESLELELKTLAGTYNTKLKELKTVYAKGANGAKIPDTWLQVPALFKDLNGNLNQLKKLSNDITKAMGNTALKPFTTSAKDSVSDNVIHTLIDLAYKALAYGTGRHSMGKNSENHAYFVKRYNEVYSKNQGNLGTSWKSLQALIPEATPESQEKGIKLYNAIVTKAAYGTKIKEKAADPAAKPAAPAGETPAEHDKKVTDYCTKFKVTSKNGRALVDAIVASKGSEDQITANLAALHFWGKKLVSESVGFSKYASLYEAEDAFLGWTKEELIQRYTGSPAFFVATPVNIQSLFTKQGLVDKPKDGDAAPAEDDKSVKVLAPAQRMAQVKNIVKTIESSTPDEQASLLKYYNQSLARMGMKSIKDVNELIGMITPLLTNKFKLGSGEEKFSLPEATDWRMVNLIESVEFYVQTEM
jgi:hypothetical protein